MSVAKQQEKLQVKLNLDSHINWTPKNAAAAWDLVLAFHDIFTLEENELGCTSSVEHEICITDSEPFKEWFRHIPLLILEEVHASCFCVDFHRLNACTKKDFYPLLWIQEALESMAGTAHFCTMDFKSGFWQVKMVPGSQQYTAFTVGNHGFYKFTCMPFGLCNAPVTSNTSWGSGTRHIV